VPLITVSIIGILKTVEQTKNEATIKINIFDFFFLTTFFLNSWVKTFEFGSATLN
jgi:hypothetical protein